MKVVISVILLIIGLSDYGFGQKEFMTLNGSKIEVFTSGQENNQPGKPVIVFENGMATKYDYWKNIINEVSNTSVVFSYNRPRIGESENDNLPPTMEHINGNLKSMLLEKGLNPPYLLVGHSFGGAYIRSFASKYPEEIAGLIFVDPIDFTKKKGYGALPYLEIGLTQHQIDSMFAKPYDDFKEKLFAEMPNYYVEEVKISGQLTKNEFKDCDSTALPDVPVHFILAGGYSNEGDDRGETIFDKKKLFRINNNLKMKRWTALLDPLKYGKLIYLSNSGHYIPNDDPETIITSIQLALNDYENIQKEKVNAEIE
ncbi:MAG: alpha/beta hydrolase [Melioribacteraceae bacterium]|nr:alpha/beta hydrolase [Melioribacteraceae bacterium]